MGSGKISKIELGERRAIQKIIIEIDENEESKIEASQINLSSREQIKEFYKKHGLVCDGFFLTGVEEHCPAPSQVPKYAKELIKLTKENVQSEAAIRFSQGKLTSEVLLDTLATERGKTYNRSDSGNAELFSELFGHIVRFDHTIDCWKIFDGKYWKPDTKKLIEELAKQAIKKRKVFNSTFLKDVASNFLLPKLLSGIYGYLLGFDINTGSSILSNSFLLSTFSSIAISLTVFPLS